MTEEVHTRQPLIRVHLEARLENQTTRLKPLLCNISPFLVASKLYMFKYYLDFDSIKDLVTFKHMYSRSPLLCGHSCQETFLESTWLVYLLYPSSEARFSTPQGRPYNGETIVTQSQQ